MDKQKLFSFGGVAILLVTMLPSGLPQGTAGATAPMATTPGAASVAAQAQDVAPDTSAFSNVWDRTDALVATGRVKRSWFWGPQAT